MTLRELAPDLATHILDTTRDDQIDSVTFGDGDAPWLAVTVVEDVGVVFYSNGVDHAAAWHGDPNEIVEKAVELLDNELDHFDSLARQFPAHEDRCDVAIHYDASSDPVFTEYLEAT